MTPGSRKLHFELIVHRGAPSRLAPLDGGDLPDLAIRYAAGGFTVTFVRQLDFDQVTAWPSTWARRLAQGQDRAIFQVDAWMAS
ncbi:MAG: hypothetical protein DMF83_26085 [Acidobacteria bacterium]|nr:MAG: hypothetical protein DMF83_26085 [Acidobacteriota bacterium]